MIRTQNAWMSCLKSDQNTRGILLVFLINKYLDLVDTGIFVLRKKTSQVSYLHVHHHCAVILWTTLTMHYADGSMYSAGTWSYKNTKKRECKIIAAYNACCQRISDAGAGRMITHNALVHLCLYVYYFAMIYSETWREKCAGWKKRLTQLQLVRALFATIAYFVSKYSCNLSESICLVPDPVCFERSIGATRNICNMSHAIHFLDKRWWPLPKYILYIPVFWCLCESIL